MVGAQSQFVVIIILSVQSITDNRVAGFREVAPDLMFATGRNRDVELGLAVFRIVGKGFDASDRCFIVEHRFQLQNLSLQRPFAVDAGVIVFVDTTLSKQTGKGRRGLFFYGQ